MAGMKLWISWDNEVAHVYENDRVPGSDVRCARGICTH